MKKLKTCMLLSVGVLCMTACGSGEDYSKYMTLGPYEGLEKNVKVDPVSEEDYQAAYKEALADYIDYEQTDDGAQEKDMVNVYLTATAGEEVLYDFTDEPYEMVIGDKEFGEEFDAYLIDKKPGDPVDFTISYGEDFEDGVLCGQTVKLQGTVDSVSRVILPEVTDEFVKENFGVETVSKWEEQLKGDLQQQNEAQAETDMRDHLITQVLEKSTIDEIPKKLYEKKYKEVEDSYQSYASMFGCSLQDIYDQFGLSKEDIEKEAKDAAKQTMVIQMIAKEQQITLDQEEYDKRLESYAKEQEYDSVKELLEDYSEEGLKEYFLQEMVKDYLQEHAK